MPQPRLSSFPKIRNALRLYQITSVITGVGLLLLVAEMILKYTPLHVELFASADRLLHFAPVIVSPECAWYSQFVPGTDGCEIESTGEGANLSLFILIAHGWFYVVYLFACFRVWSLMRWRFPRFLMLAGGGIVPFLSFVMEIIVARDVRTYLAEREERAAEKRAQREAAPVPSLDTSDTPEETAR